MSLLEREAFINTTITFSYRRKIKHYCFVKCKTYNAVIQISYITKDNSVFYVHFIWIIKNFVDENIINSFNIDDIYIKSFLRSTQ